LRDDPRQPPQRFAAVKQNRVVVAAETSNVNPEGDGEHVWRYTFLLNRHCSQESRIVAFEVCVVRPAGKQPGAVQLSVHLIRRFAGFETRVNPCRKLILDRPVVGRLQLISLVRAKTFRCSAIRAVSTRTCPTAYAAKSIKLKMTRCKVAPLPQ